ncbi:MAG: hypothetical protein ACRDFC_04875, partial [Ignavibacteria bacterium]
YNTRAASIDENGNSSVYKILISGKEYFLLENRNRDAKKNEQTIYFVRSGVRDSIRFTSDLSGFENADVWQLKGNITDVDELDWSLPGLKNDTADFQGGILIWHIDENVIDANILTNTINADINHRGVDLEEAKGAQDIGVVINTPFGQFIGDGTIVDYWFNGNHYVPSNIYRNEFTQTSFPNSKSYSNVNSRVCVRNFSTIDSVMSFNFEFCSGITNINTFPRFVGIDTSGNAQPIGIDYSGDGKDEIFVNCVGNVFGFRDNGSVIDTTSTGTLFGIRSTFMPTYYTNTSLNHSFPCQTLIVTIQDSIIKFSSICVTDTGYSFPAGLTYVLNPGTKILTPAALYDSIKTTIGAKDISTSRGIIFTVSRQFGSPRP